MQSLLYAAARAIVFLIQSLPLDLVARVGRLLGIAAFHLDARHRNVCLRNLTLCFQSSLTPSQIRGVAKENFRRIGENFLSAIRTASMSLDELTRYADLSAFAVFDQPRTPEPRGYIAAIGHFGNFEIYAREAQFSRRLRPATTYRALGHPGLTRLMQELRATSGCRFFERRSDARALREFLRQPRFFLGLLADQHAGKKGLILPFLGRDCSTTPAPAILALRHHANLQVIFCRRTALARWSIVCGNDVPTLEHGHPRSISAIMLDINRQFEQEILRDPANWFWVHDRWKPVRRPSRQPPQPATLPAS